MKHISVFSKFAFISCLFLMGCDGMTVSTGDGSNKISGNGKVTSETRDIKSFTAISVEGVFNVTLEQGNKESVKIETDGNIIPLIITEVVNDTLKIKLKDNTTIKKTDKMNIYITLVNIMNLNTAGVGSLKCETPLHLNELDLHLEGIGATDLSLDVQKLNIKSEIVGVLVLSGIAKEAAIKHSGVGMIEAFKLRTEKMILHTDGVGGAEVCASKELSIDASGVGGVEYRGGATKKEIHNNGVGKVVCEDCN